MAEADRHVLWGHHQEILTTKYGQQQNSSDDVKKQLEKVRETISEKTKGSLRFHYHPPTGQSSKVTADVTWEGEVVESTDAYELQTQCLPHEALSKTLSHANVEYPSN